MAVPKVYHFVCFLVSFHTLLHLASAAYCFFPNGTEIPIPKGAPPDLSTGCPITAANASHSMCSSWQQSTSNFLNRVSGVKCRPDGLVSDEGGDAVYRTSCTDPTWQDPGCIKLCMNETANFGRDMLVTPCDDGSYCCGSNAVAQSCCTNNHGVFIKDGQETSVNPNAMASQSGATSSSGPSASASSDQRSRNSKDSGVSIAAVVGGVIGVVAVLLAISGAGLYLLFRKRRRATAEANIQELNRPSRYEWVSMAEVDGSNTQKIKMPGQSVMRPELGEAKLPPVEMDVMPR